MSLLQSGADRAELLELNHSAPGPPSTEYLPTVGRWRRGQSPTRHGGEMLGTGEPAAVRDFSNAERRIGQQFARPRQAPVHQPAMRWLARAPPKEIHEMCRGQTHHRGHLVETDVVRQMSFEVIDRVPHAPIAIAGPAIVHEGF